jgi:RNase H-fold protein (predicted Holliday junction resolvase)
MTIPAGAAAGLDPGRSKCGLVLTDPERKVIRQALVLPPAATWRRLRDWRDGMGLVVVVVGDGTGSRPWLDRLGELLPVLLVDESHTTLEARHRYWDLFPPTGWRRLLPEGLRHPPRDWDDVVAQLLLERWLGRQLPRRLGTAAEAALRSRPAP